MASKNRSDISSSDSLAFKIIVSVLGTKTHRRRNSSILNSSFAQTDVAPCSPLIR